MDQSIQQQKGIPLSVVHTGARHCKDDRTGWQIRLKAQGTLRGQSVRRRFRPLFRASARNSRQTWLKRFRNWSGDENKSTIRGVFRHLITTSDQGVPNFVFSLSAKI